MTLLRWFSGDERTLGLVLGGGLATFAFFRLDTLRGDLGVPAGPEAPLAMVAVVAAVAWWSMLPRGFVWLDPAVLTWRDVDRNRLVSRRILGGWFLRVVALGYLLALLAAIGSVPRAWTAAGTALVLGTALVALAAIRRPRTSVPVETLLVFVPAAFVTFVKPGQSVLIGLAAAATLAAAVLAARPRPHNPGRSELVDGWRDRVLRSTGLHFLDLAMLLPAARPGRPRRLGRPVALRLAWLGVVGRARLVPTAALLALTTITALRTFPALPDVLVITVIGYLSVLPFGAALGELWASPGKRRWVGLSNRTLRAANLVVLAGVAAVWVVAVSPVRHPDHHGRRRANGDQETAELRHPGRGGHPVRHDPGRADRPGTARPRPGPPVPDLPPDHGPAGPGLVPSAVSRRHASPNSRRSSRQTATSSAAGGSGYAATAARPSSLLVFARQGCHAVPQARQCGRVHGRGPLEDVQSVDQVVDRAGRRQRARVVGQRPVQLRERRRDGRRFHRNG